MRLDAHLWRRRGLSESIAEALRRAPLFEGLGRRSLEVLAAGADDIDVPAGRVLCREGEMDHQFFVIVEGEVEVTKGGMPVRRLGTGSFFGETALIEREPRTTTVTALTSLRFFVFRGHRFQSMLSTYPEVERRVLRDLVAENVAVRRVAELSWREQLEVNAYEALHDSLTGLPNRTLFRDRVEQALLAATREWRRVGVLLMDLDRFKEVNDTLGHEAGDLLLKEFSTRLRDLTRESDTVARFGGDEFALLAAAVAPDATAAIIKRVQAALDHPFSVHGLAIGMEASIGVAHFPDDGRDVETLIRHADAAMYTAKEMRTGHAFFDHSGDASDTARLTLVNELRRAIEGQLELHYQPKAALGSGEITSVEALVRWRHPVRGLVGPDEFIPLAQQTTLVKPLTMWVIDEALRQCRAWEDEGLVLSVAVNLSPRNLLDEQLPTDVARLLLERGLHPSRLELEITESAILSDPFRAGKVIEQLSEMGIRLSIDDFGTGYSSLAHLKSLPVNELKIDQSFVARMVDNEDDAIIVRSTVELGKNLGLVVVAEGVENEETWKRLQLLGCDAAQGYFLGRPLPPVELVTALRSRTPGGSLAAAQLPGSGR